MTDTPTQRSLILSIEAQQDIDRRLELLSQERGRDFAANWLETFSIWLAKLTDGIVLLGTSHPFSAQARSFPYKKQATILVEYTPTEMRIIRVYFAGQDWSA